MKGPQLLSFVVAALLVIACRPEGTTPVNPREVPPETIIHPTSPPVVSEEPQVSAGTESTVVTGQTIYVPIYSHVYFQNKSRMLNLTATLSIRNTDSIHSIAVTAVRYYDTHGRLVRQYIEQPLRLAALATTEFLVEEKDTQGGSGANFIVEWNATELVTEPIVEAVLVNSSLGIGFAFVSPGRVIKNNNAPGMVP